MPRAVNRTRRRPTSPDYGTVTRVIVTSARARARILYFAQLYHEVCVTLTVFDKEIVGGFSFFSYYASDFFPRCILPVMTIIFVSMMSHRPVERLRQIASIVPLKLYESKPGGRPGPDFLGGGGGYARTSMLRKRNEEGGGGGRKGRHERAPLIKRRRSIYIAETAFGCARARARSHKSRASAL